MNSKYRAVEFVNEEFGVEISHDDGKTWKEFWNKERFQTEHAVLARVESYNAAEARLAAESPSVRRVL